jgi:F-type H+-transporting ATPase subunit delta
MATLRTSANRYAKALFDVALQEKADLAKINQDLADVAEVMATNRDLMLIAQRIAVPDATRKAVMEQIADKLGLSVQVKKLVLLLTESRKLAIAKDLAESFQERLLAYQNIVRAEVTSATPLSPEKQQALADSLSRVTGKKVELSVSVDPELLGGVVARIGSTVYDGSVTTQLQRMRQEISSQ